MRTNCGIIGMRGSSCRSRSLAKHWCKSAKWVSECDHHCIGIGGDGYQPAWRKPALFSAWVGNRRMEGEGHPIPIGRKQLNDGHDRP